MEQTDAIKTSWRRGRWALRRFMPQGLLGRSVTILVAMVVWMHAISGYVFVYRHQAGIRSLLAQDVAMKVAMVRTAMAERGQDQAQQVARQMSAVWVGVDRHESGRQHQNPGLRALAHEHPRPDATKENMHFPVPKSLQAWGPWQVAEDVKKSVQPHVRFPVQALKNARWIALGCGDGVAGISGWMIVARKTVLPYSFMVFAGWGLGSSLLFLCVAMIILRNQIRPLQRLVRWAQTLERFQGRQGLVRHRDQMLQEPRLQGAQEIRSLTQALIASVHRVRQHFYERQRMLTGISHDLRTPLTRIKLHLQLMPDSPDVAALRSDVDQMIAMVSRYLSFASADVDDLHMMDMHPFLDAFMRAQPSDIAWHCDAGVWVWAHPDALRRCLQNLVDNGVRYRRRHLYLWVESLDDSVAVHVQDDGPGIPHDQRARVVQPFVRGDTGRHLQGDQVGLGLSIVQRLLHDMGGTLTITDAQRDGTPFADIASFESLSQDPQDRQKFDSTTVQTSLPVGQGGARLTMILRRADPPPFPASAPAS